MELALPASAEDLAVAQSMVHIHGAQAITRAEALVHANASVGNASSAAKWLRVMVLIEYSSLASTTI
jgi:hypothetical protein